MKFRIHRSHSDPTSPGGEGPGPAPTRQWYFTIVSSNGRILASSELYHNREDTENVINIIVAGASTAKIEIT